MAVGSIYLFNIYENDISSITLNLGPMTGGGAIAAPVKTSTPPYTPNSVSALKTNQNASQGAPGLFMVGTGNINTIVINFGGMENWTAQLYIPGPDDRPNGMPFNMDGFIYIAFKQLYVFDDNGNNIPQPQNGNAPFAQAVGGGSQLRAASKQSSKAGAKKSSKSGAK